MSAPLNLSRVAALTDEGKPAIHVICLGSGGGPSEDNVTGLIVRSTSSGWAKGSLLAVDAGVHLAAVTRILGQQLPLIYDGQPRADSNGNIFQTRRSSRSVDPLDSSPGSSPSMERGSSGPPAEPTILESGPFAGLPLPHVSARANAAYIVRSYVSTYLITHPHLDHLSGFAINTAAFHATSRPKRLAALPFTVDAIKRHIFNDVIWPNLTDEDGGVGFVTFQRLKEGGDVMVGDGEGRGYIEVCDGLGAKGFKISHGKCMKPHSDHSSHRHGSVGNAFETPYGYNQGRRLSRQASLSHLALPETLGQTYHSPTTTHSPREYPSDAGAAVDSTAYFIRDTATSREVLIFGDVEPDSISVAPRLARVWAEAAPKIAAGILAGLFIECSYDDSQGDAVLFGHLAPRHLIAEMQVLADMVKEERAVRASEKARRKRKRTANGTSASFESIDETDRKRSRSTAERSLSMQLRRSSVPDIPDTPTPPPLSRLDISLPKSKPVDHLDRPAGPPPLKGLRVIVIHVKDTLKDGPPVSERILSQLDAHAAVLDDKGEALGCEFVVSESGKDYWF